MFSHIMIGSNDIARSKKFYDALFAAMGAQPGAKDASVPFLKWSYKKRCTNAIVGVPIGGSWLWRVKGSSWLRKRLKN